MGTPIKYMDAEGNWQEMIVPSSAVPGALLGKITALEAVIADLENTINGLQAYVESE